LPGDWLPLVLCGERCGWLEPATAACLAQPPSPFVMARGHLELAAASDLLQAAPQAMQFAARRLHEAGIVRAWRSEQVDVRTEDGRAIATVERAACRVLGIATRSVHLNAFRPDGWMWVARRASHKLNDPDRWDNLAGGMIAAGEVDIQALEREAYEEAALRLEQMQPARGSQLRVQRMVPDGLMIETIHVFDVQLPADFVPVNLDGEVAAFETWSLESVVEALERGEITLEASLAAVDGLRRILGQR
jgi:8-oxo-dGTP pyrophosphatase MutT (NUDIX family)